MSRPTIALACIMKNEEKNIPILLESVKDCFDEIHLTDTGSTDNSVELAKSLGATVHHFEWVNDFSAARNASIAPIKTDYICWIDLDDSMFNPEEFKLWRDEIMATADLWLAAYHYASNAEGHPVCTFARERVFKNDGRFQFKYFVHEGLVHKEGKIPVASYVQTWAVKHRRTQEDVVKDKGRNLKLFEFHKDKLDTRMKFYFGKEYFENGDPNSAVFWLNEALQGSNLEAHDRLLATQFCVYSLVQTHQFEKAAGVALSGVQIFPHRAELWNSVGDCFLKLGKIHEALPFYAAAKACPYHDPVQTGMAQAVFNQREAYTFYPRNQIARILTNTGQFDASLRVLRECEAVYPNPETEKMMEEIEKIQKMRPGTGQVKKKVDDIVISGVPGGPYEWNEEIYRKKGIGGSETAAVEMAHWMAKLSGRRVIVFNNSSAPSRTSGVDYVPFSQAASYFAEHEPYFHVAWRHNVKLTEAPTYLWNHDLYTPGGEQTHYTKSLVLSEFHRSFLRTHQGVPMQKIRITRNGIDPKRFEGLKHEKKPVVVWRSSPDRGLDRALAVMDLVRKEMDLELHVYYGFDNMYKNNCGALADELKRQMNMRPWVKFKGNVEQKKMSEECAEAMVWLYPTNFCETYCIGAIESLCEGVYPVVRKYGALKDTLRDASDKGMASLVDSDCVTAEEQYRYASEVISAVREKKWERVQVDPETYSWRQVAETWLQWFEEEKACLTTPS